MVPGSKLRDQRAGDRAASGSDPGRVSRHGQTGGFLGLGFAGSDHGADRGHLLDDGRRIVMKKMLSGAGHGLLLVLLLSGTPGLAAEMTSPEDTLRALVQANADKDIATLARLMAHDADIVSYTIGGRKYVGWPQFEREMLEEFRTVTRLEIPIIALKVWTRGEVAWFAMELDYIRYIGTGPERRRMLLPLRETGVLERRMGKWVLTAWHESFRAEAAPLTVS